MIGLGVAAFFYKTLVVEAAESIVLDKLIADFDYMVFSDFWRIHGSAFTPVWLAALAVGVLYFLINIFMVGGIFYQYKYGDSGFRFKAFVKSGFSLLGKYLLLGVIVFSIGSVVVLFSVIFFFLFVKIAEGGNERTYILWMIPPSLLLVLILSVLAVVADYARYLIFKNRALNPISGFTEGVSFVFKNFRTIGFYWLIVAVSLLIGLLYLLLDTIIGMRSEVTIVLMMIIQQTVIFGRIFLKNWHYAFVHIFSENKSVLLPSKPSGVD